jgi:hypothetical protein
MAESSLVMCCSMTILVLLPILAASYSLRSLAFNRSVSARFWDCICANCLVIFASARCQSASAVTAGLLSAISILQQINRTSIKSGSLSNR